MFSNKSGELLRLATVHRIAGPEVSLFKHSLDDRYQGADAISTHGGASMAAEPVSTSSAVSLLASVADVVAIDAAQLLGDGLAAGAGPLFGAVGPRFLPA